MGTGGQGAVTVAAVLARAIFLGGLPVLQVQTHGAEVRGGLVLADVMFGTDKDDPVNEFNVRRFDYLILMSMFKWNDVLAQINDGATIIFPESLKHLVKRTEIHSLKIAFLKDGTILTQLESPAALNLSYLGAFTKLTFIITPENVKDAIKHEIKQQYWSENLKAFELGMENIESNE
ncbi:MAG: 2-oxoacid:acceptor oxidoreductase family protein [Candidatus Helarchaeales archaeon]